MAITPDFIETSLIISLGALIFAIVFQAIVLYLNYKQAKVNTQMKELIKIAKDIKKLLGKRR